jgi:hypothetical protein
MFHDLLGKYWKAFVMSIGYKHVNYESECRQHKIKGVARDLFTHMTKEFMAGLHMTSLLELHKTWDEHTKISGILVEAKNRHQSNLQPH